MMIQVGSQWFVQHNENNAKEISKPETIYLNSDFESFEANYLDEDSFVSDNGESAGTRENKSKKSKLSDDHLCKICNKKFISKSLACKHVQSCHKKTKNIVERHVQSIEADNIILRSASKIQNVKYQCLVCEIFKPSMNSMTRHFKIFHTEIENIESSIKINCDKRVMPVITSVRSVNCGAKLENSSKKPEKNSEIHQCLICEIFKPTRSSTLRHLKQYHPEVNDAEKYIGPKVGATTTASLKIISHSNEPTQSDVNGGAEVAKEPKALTLEKSNLFCKFCDISFTTIEQMMKHIKEIHNFKMAKKSAAQPLQCEYCKKISETKLERMVHIYKNHDKSMDVFKSINWSKIFKREFGVYKCVPCGTNYALGEDYCHHLKQHHPLEFDALEPLKLGLIKVCDKCDSPYLFNRREEGICCFQAKKFEYRIMCEICGQLVVQGDIFKDHMNNHTGQTPYECNHCFKRFAASKDLNRHLHSHRAKIRREAAKLPKFNVEF